MRSWLRVRLASTSRIHAVLAKSKLKLGSRLSLSGAACINPLNSPSLSVLNAGQRACTKTECVIFQLVKVSKDGCVVTVATVLANLVNKARHHKKFQNGK